MTKPEWVEPQVTNNPITCSTCLNGSTYVGVGWKTRCYGLNSCCSLSNNVKKCNETLNACKRSFKCEKHHYIKPKNYYRTVECKDFLYM